ncbi:unnamed protein product, partial [Rotaria sp. Silwood1]
TNLYEQWRANIHRELEEDLQRQVRELLEETEREERLAKLQRQFIRYRPLPDLSINTDQQININPSIYINKYINKQSSFMSINNDSTLLYGNSIIKSNKATILNIFDQQLLDGHSTNTYVNKHGIIIDEDGPF